MRGQSGWCDLRRWRGGGMDMYCVLAMRECMYGIRMCMYGCVCAGSVCADVHVLDARCMYERYVRVV